MRLATAEVLLDVNEESIRQLLVFYKQTVARTAGNGMKFTKFHQILHVPPRENHPEKCISCISSGRHVNV